MQIAANIRKKREGGSLQIVEAKSQEKKRGKKTAADLEEEGGEMRIANS